jgi:ATP-binding cassette, subfamily B, bacterial
MESDLAESAGSGITVDDILASPQEPRDWRRLARLIRQAWLLTWRAGRWPLLISSSMQLVSALLIGAQVLLARQLLEVAFAGHGSPAHTIHRMIPVLIAYGVAYSGTRYAFAVEAGQTELLTELVGNAARARILDTVGRLDLITFEDASFYDRLQRATNSAGFRCIEMVRGLIALVGSAARILGALVILYVLQPLLLPPVLLAAVPLWYAIRRSAGERYQFIVGMTPLERQRQYLHYLLTDRDSAKEVRSFGLSNFLRERFDNLGAQQVRELRLVVRRRTRRQLIAAAENSLLVTFVFALLVWFYAIHRISLASAIAAMAVLLQLSGALGGIGMGSSGIYEASLFVDDYLSFITPNDEVSRAAQKVTSPGPFRVLVADGVTFTYPGAACPSLADVSLRINAGEVVALVGENGSGKTTMAKLLAGLYRPNSGRILWDGRDVSSYDTDALRSMITIVFQDFIRYHLSARDNIGLGRVERLHDSAAIEDAARMAGADGIVSKLPNGFDTVLGRQFFGGHDLSVGQWQRMALARAFFRDSPFIVLDEPTASLDARAEQQVFERVRELFRGRAVLLISHRFANVRMADRIYVLQSGKVIEHGDHSELVAAGGLYAELFSLQAAAYVSEV